MTVPRGAHQQLPDKDRARRRRARILARGQRQGDVADDSAIAHGDQEPDIRALQSAGKPLRISLADDGRRPIGGGSGALGSKPSLIVAATAPASEGVANRVTITVAQSRSWPVVVSTVGSPTRSAGGLSPMNVEAWTRSGRPAADCRIARKGAAGTKFVCRSFLALSATVLALTPHLSDEMIGAMADPLADPLLEPFAFERANGVQKALRRFAASGPGSWLFARVLHRIDRPVYRLTRGRHTFASLLSGIPVVMLTTTGARSGRPRTVPVLGLPTADGLAVIASNFGQQRHPGWYHNLHANPEGSVAVDGQTRRFRAVEVENDWRRRIWEEGLRVYPGWSQYERRASNRRIAVFILDPV